MLGTLTISPECGLLLDAIAPAHERRRGPQAEPVRWAEVLRLAAWHRLEPLVYRHLSVGGQAPEHVLARLEGAYLTNAARNLLLRSSLERVLAALAAESVPAMPLKGAALLEMVYPDPALREMTDLDILVPIPALQAANAVLRAIGYRPHVPEQGPNAAWTPAEHHHDPPLVDHTRVAAVELHHHLLRGDRRGELEIADVWRRARPVPGATHLLPSAEDLLLHICMHFILARTIRSDGSLGQIADIAWILERMEIDWPALTRAAETYDLCAGVYLALLATRELGLPVPEAPLEALRPAELDARLGRRLVSRRVLRAEPSLAMYSLRTMLTPGRECLAQGYGANPDRRLSLAHGYARRAIARLPLARAALARPLSTVSDYRLNRQLASLKSPPPGRGPLSIGGTQR